MAWDTEGTKRKIVDAATAQFALTGPAGTTIERIAKEAGVNKERVYAYYGGKDALFAHVLAEQMRTATASVPVPSTGPDDVAAYAGRLFDYLDQHPHLLRLLQWEALTITGGVPDEQHRREMYAERTGELAQGQATGNLTSSFDADLLNVLILGVVGYWTMVPQVARMIAGPSDGPHEKERRRAAVVEAARRLATPLPA
ncbi:TetR family transcriptional regulator [Flexivirga oryzae]|uniref:AcrR family transcriptional regulator n=1 Tax=Flexivirga oryzae TaxID=1794944 RepID=A0A839NCS6_9MICO|nr:AcrR family transcriptional regulator [Flexivirga oryzae]